MINLQFLTELAVEIFGDPEITIKPHVLSFTAPPNLLARETAGFFYASFVLSVNERQAMLNELEKYFVTNMENGESFFSMPINQSVIRKG